MNLNRVNRVVVLLFVIGVTVFSACKKEEGEGGKATIEGKLYNNLYDPNGKFLEREESIDADVYIIYGDNSIYDDNTNSQGDGSYNFKYLRKGKYKIFAYSDCNTCASGIEKKEIKVEISDKKEVVVATDLELVKNIGIEDGSGYISGMVQLTDYTTSTSSPSVYAKLDEDVYIVYDNDQAYFERTKTGAGGTFQFGELIKGSYKVYAFSDCLTCPSGTETKQLLTQISVDGQSVQLPNLSIEKR